MQPVTTQTPASSYHCNCAISTHTWLTVYTICKELYSRAIGGTSARCDTQPYFVYSACNGGATSAESLLDRFNEYITLSTYLLHQKYSVLNYTNIDTYL